MTPPPHRAARLALALALAAPAAVAHGGLWRPDEVRVDPTDDAHVVVRSDVWGFVETRDGGATWRWLCAEAAGGDSIVVQRTPFVLLPGGGLLVGAGFSGVFRASGSLCESGAAPYFADAGRCGAADCLAMDIALESWSSPRALVLTAGQRAGGGYANLIFRTPDGGATWEALPDSLPRDVFASGLAVAPTDAGTLYVTVSTVAPPIELRLLRSRDGGRSWSESALPLTVPVGAPPVTVRPYGVSPRDRETVFLWADADGGDGTTKAPDRLLVSTDGGASARVVFTAKDDLPGFAFAPDATAVFVGGTDDGLLSASLADLTGDAGGGFRIVNPEATWGLAFTRSGLLAGRQDYGGTDTRRMSLGLSRDRGASFEPALTVCDITPMQCPEGSRGARECTSLFYGTSNFQYDQQSLRCASADAGTPGIDAGAAFRVDGGRLAPTAEHASSCGCRTAAAGPSQSAVAAGLSLVAVARRRRRSRRSGAGSGRTCAVS